MQTKQPVIQSVFDRRLLQKDDMFFLRAVKELETYQRNLIQDGKSLPIYKEIADDPEQLKALHEVFGGLTSAQSALRGVFNSFDILSEESVL